MTTSTPFTLLENPRISRILSNSELVEQASRSTDEATRRLATIAEEQRQVLEDTLATLESVSEDWGDRTRDLDLIRDKFIEREFTCTQDCVSLAIEDLGQSVNDMEDAVSDLDKTIEKIREEVD